MRIIFKPARRAILPSSLVQSLREHKGNQIREREFLGTAYEDNDLVFAMPDGKAVVPWTLTKSFSHLVRRAGIPYIRLHDVRHTHASLLAKHGVPIEVASKRLGHAQVGITYERYVHVYRDQDAEAAAIFDDAVA
jgi:integrase